MIGRTISHYKIVEELGQGGMGVVYKAEDKRLKRTVALKFLQSSGFEDKDYRLRFVREARAAAALDHPNICTVYEIDENESGIFIAMAYIDGIDLKRKIHAAPLEPDEAVNIAIQVARGLEAAHAKGVIHRDVKSANIMLTPDGKAILMDFGLALIRGATKITRPKMVAGTIAYMSPEQLRGDPLDERTDIWSLGVCLYEMLAGNLPFTADYDTALAYSILNEDPAPLSERRPGMPFVLELIIESAMSKNRDKRYEKMNDMRAELESVREEQTGTAGTGPSQGQTTASIAVLPFADMSEEKDQEYFCDGITDEIINDLVQVEHLRVVSRTSSFAFKDKPEDVRGIGRRLGVKCVLEGSVRKSGTRVRITAQLINVADGYHLWSDQYDRELRDIFAIQEEIGRNIVEALKIELTDREKRALQKSVTQDIEAYDFYLRGRQFFYQTQRSNLAKARDLFSQAIRKDSRFARAYAGMADCHSYLYWYFERSQENLDRAMAASHKALELDPELAEAHAARGLALTLGKEYEKAESEYREALRLNPNLFEAYYFYARTRFVQGDIQGAARLFERACDANPDDHQAPMMLGFVLKSLKLDDKARTVYRRGLKNVERHLKLNPEDSRALYLGSSALIDLGKKEKALQYSMRAVSLDPDDSYILYGISCNFCRMGEVEEAIYYFARALKAGFAHKEWIENDSDLDPIKDDPRFKNLVSKLK